MLNQQHLRIIGIDPGTRNVGFAIIEARNHRALLPQDYKILDAGVIKAQENIDPYKRLGCIHQTLFKLLEETTPGVCVIEKAFIGINANTSLKLGQARGALMTALFRCNIEVREVAPTQVKKLITGKGHANKEEVSQSLLRLVGFQRGSLPFDTTDALAIALSYGLIQ